VHILRNRGRLAIAAAAAAVLPLSLLGAGLAGTASATPKAALPPIKHVWIIELENEGYAQSFGDPAANPYLAKVLPSMGALLKNYYAIGHNSADNYIAQISGQAPDEATQQDCGRWTPFMPTNHVQKPFHQLVGNGCVYPASVPTLGNQLSDAKLSWKAYLQDMGNLPKRDHTINVKGAGAGGSSGPACGHPIVDHGDNTEGAKAADQYASRHQGFMYFESVISNNAFCAAHNQSFQPLLSDLSKASTTPAFSWLSPNLCNDGHDAPCADGDPGGLTQINGFLQIWVPEILNSPAYKQGGLLLVTFDEGNSSKACCGETTGKSPSHPNVVQPGINGPGGGRVGLVALSPFIKPGTVSTVQYNHYSMLRTIEDIFGLSHLGDAAMPQVKSFGSDVFTNS
jgi:hypothetical protein